MCALDNVGACWRTAHSPMGTLTLHMSVGCVAQGGAQEECVGGFDLVYNGGPLQTNKQASLARPHPYL